MAVQISRILHAGYIFKHNQTQLAFDPIFENPFSVNCHAFPSVQFDHEKIKQLKFDAVFISHYHDDHCSMESLDLLDRSTPIYMYCVFDEMFELIRSLGFKNVHSLELNRPVLVGDFEVTPRRALDEDVDSLFQIKADGLHFLNVVDSWIDPDTLELLKKEGPWDMILWPFQTMQELEVLSPMRASSPSRTLPEEWTHQLQVLNPRLMIPSSCQFIFEEWSWYNQVYFPISYQIFKDSISSILPSTLVKKLNPGETLTVSPKNLLAAPPLNWIKTAGEQHLDYDFKPLTYAPKTSEIAQRLPSATAEQTERVFKYCQTAILKRFAELGEPNDLYFQKEIFWELCLYDQEGQCTHFYYSVFKDQMALLAEKPQEISWRTEVPLVKLFNALEEGESLTSMYMRINDTIYPLEIERKLKDVDVLEDPLIRCLFNGVFAAYQKHQLKRIFSRAEKTTSK